MKAKKKYKKASCKIMYLSMEEVFGIIKDSINGKKWVIPKKKAKKVYYK